jgi:hypothetical protein
MTETEQQTPGPSLQPGEVAANIAKDAQENLAGLEVVSVGSMFADEMAGELYLQVYIVLPNRAGDELDHACARSRHPVRSNQSHGLHMPASLAGTKWPLSQPRVPMRLRASAIPLTGHVPLRSRRCIHTELRMFSNTGGNRAD